MIISLDPLTVNQRVRSSSLRAKAERSEAVRRELKWRCVGQADTYIFASCSNNAARSDSSFSRITDRSAGNGWW